MKRRRTVSLGVLGFLFAGSMAAWGAVGPPQINSVSANFSLTATDLAMVSCTGSDGAGYFSITGTWKGNEQDWTTPVTDHNLSGALTYAATLTVRGDSADYVGVMTGTATLRTPPVIGKRPGVKVYSGPLTLVVTLNGNGASLFDGRGLLDANTFVPAKGGGTTQDGKEIGNVEANLIDLHPGSGNFLDLFGGLDGHFGDATPSGPAPVVRDYAVSTNSKTCA
jgi:hypothetical protein